MISSPRGKDNVVHPTVARRRQVNKASAPSLLTAMLAEFALARPEPLWTQTILGALECLDIGQKSARQAVARIAAEGWLTSQRHGRRVRWQLTASGRRRLTDCVDHADQLGQADTNWDSRWLVAVVSVPESKREARHKLRTRLSRAGFGSPGWSMWVSPHTGLEWELKNIVADLKLTDEAMSFIAQCGALGDVHRLVSAAWDLDELSGRYEHFIDEFRGLQPRNPMAALLAQIRLRHEWHRLSILDPRLPAELLSSNWSGFHAAKLFNNSHSAWRTLADLGWSNLIARYDQALDRPPGQSIG